MAEKLAFYPHDVIYRIESKRPVVYMFGRTEQGAAVCIRDPAFDPYFYIHAEQERSLVDKLKALSVQKGSDTSNVIRVEHANKAINGRDITLLKVFTRLPGDVPIIKEEVSRWDEVIDCYEYDIPFVRRYMIDKRIIPLMLTVADAVSHDSAFPVPVFAASSVAPSGDETRRNVQIASIDLETYAKEREIDLSKNPILMASVHSGTISRVITWKEFSPDQADIVFVEDEASLLRELCQTIKQLSPDIITGYNTTEFDLPYIRKRCDILGVNFDIGLDGSELSVSNRGSERQPQIKMPGIIHLDMYRFITRIMRGSLGLESYSLDSVCEKMLGEKKDAVDIMQLHSAWDSHDRQKLSEFARYNLKDAVLAYELCKRMLPQAIELSKITGLLPSEIERNGFSQLVENYLLTRASEYGEIAPNKPSGEEIRQRRSNTYEGGFVFEPKPGLYNDIVIYDFRSLYPTIISSHNISDASAGCDCCRDTSRHIDTDGRTFWYCQKKKAFIPSLIGDLISRRMRIKEIQKKKDDPFLSARQQSLKLLANSFYGYLGFFASRWYSLDSARATTALGRDYIKETIKKAGSRGFSVLYSDTDSIFLSLEGNPQEEAEKFVSEINDHLPGLMELEFEGFYPRGLFVSARVGQFGAKKKYALIDMDGKLHIKGFEAIRRNWSEIAKECQENVLLKILSDGDEKNAFSYVKSLVMKVKAKEIPKEKMEISTQLVKDIGDYDSVGPHVEIARRLKEKGIDVRAGKIIRYIIAEGSGLIRDKAKLPDEILGNGYDAEYYVNNQIVPAVDKIFEVFGRSGDEILTGSSQMKLGDF